MDKVRVLLFLGVVYLLITMDLSVAEGNAISANLCRQFYHISINQNVPRYVNLERLQMAPLAGTLYTGSASDVQVIGSALSTVKWSEWLGKRVQIDFNTSKEEPFSSPSDFFRYRQGIISAKMIEGFGKESVDTILDVSGSHKHQIEIAQLQVVFKDGRYLNSKIIEGTAHSFDMEKETIEIIKNIDWDSVSDFRIYHTHPSVQPIPLSISDKYLVKERLGAYVPQKIPVHIFAVAAHAEGEIVFVQTRLSEERENKLATTGFVFDSNDLTLAGPPRAFYSNQRQESAREIFGNGEHIVLGINKKSEIYLVIGNSRYNLKKTNETNTKIQQTDLVDEGILVRLIASRVDRVSLSKSQKVGAFLKGFVSPVEPFLHQLKISTGIHMDLSIKQALGLDANGLVEFIQEKGFKDAFGNPVATEIIEYQVY